MLEGTFLPLGKGQGRVRLMLEKVFIKNIETSRALYYLLAEREREREERNTKRW